MKNIRYLLAMTVLIALLLSAAIYGYSNLREISYDRDVLYQTSTINALLEGVYDGDVTFKELHKYGDIGIGTFDCLDGEMIGLDGTFYQIKTDGVAYVVDDSMKTPFAVVTFFDRDRSILIVAYQRHQDLR